MQFFVYFDHNRFLISLALPVKQKKGTPPLPGAKHNNFCSNNSFTLGCISENHFKVDQYVEPKKDGKRVPVRTIRQATWP